MIVVVAVIFAVAVIAVSSGAVKIPGLSSGSGTAKASDQATLAAQRSAADKLWASATCTSILDWKNEIQRDGTHFDLGFGPQARVQDAIAATNRMLSQLDKAGLPPGGRTTQTQADLSQLRARIASQLSSLEGAASSVAGGNFTAIGTLIDDLASAKALPGQITGELRSVVSADLGLSLAETHACRQLVGIPI